MTPLIGIDDEIRWPNLVIKFKFVIPCFQDTHYYCFDKETWILITCGYIRTGFCENALSVRKICFSSYFRPWWRFLRARSDAGGVASSKTYLSIMSKLFTTFIYEISKIAKWINRKINHIINTGGSWSKFNLISYQTNNENTMQRLLLKWDNYYGSEDIFWPTSHNEGEVWRICAHHATCKSSDFLCRLNSYFFLLGKHFYPTFKNFLLNIYTITMYLNFIFVLNYVLVLAIRAGDNVLLASCDQPIHA